MTVERFVVIFVIVAPGLGYVAINGLWANIYVWLAIVGLCGSMLVLPLTDVVEHPLWLKIRTSVIVALFAIGFIASMMV